MDNNTRIMVRDALGAIIVSVAVLIASVALAFGIAGQVEARPPTTVTYKVCLPDDADPTTFGYDCEVTTDQNLIDTLVGMNYNDVYVWVDPLTDLVYPYDCTNKASFSISETLDLYAVFFEPCMTDTCLSYTGMPYADVQALLSP